MKFVNNILRILGIKCKHDLQFLEDVQMVSATKGKPSVTVSVSVCRKCGEYIVEGKE